MDPGRYDRTRPDYPDELIRRITAGIAGSDMLDVGCGTGIAARQFHAAGCTVLGVEPDARMAAWARERGLVVEVATFENWDPAGRVFDAVVAGQAWHWVDPVAGAAKAAQTLRPGGRFAAFWNVDRPPTALAEAFAEAYRRVLLDSPMAARTRAAMPNAYDPLCAAAADGITQTGAFGEPERWRHAWQRTYTREDWLDLLPTQGLHTRLPAATLDKLLDRVGAAIDAVGGRLHDALRNGDRYGGALMIRTRWVMPFGQPHMSVRSAVGVAGAPRVTPASRRLPHPHGMCYK